MLRATRLNRWIYVLFKLVLTCSVSFSLKAIASEGQAVGLGETGAAGADDEFMTVERRLPFIPQNYLGERCEIPYKRIVHQPVPVDGNRLTASCYGREARFKDFDGYERLTFLFDLKGEPEKLRLPFEDEKGRIVVLLRQGISESDVLRYLRSYEASERRPQVDVCIIRAVKFENIRVNKTRIEKLANPFNLFLLASFELATRYRWDKPFAVLPTGDLDEITTNFRIKKTDPRAELMRADGYLLSWQELYAELAAFSKDRAAFAVSPSRNIAATSEIDLSPDFRFILFSNLKINHLEPLQERKTFSQDLPIVKGSNLAILTWPQLLMPFVGERFSFKTIHSIPNLRAHSDNDPFPCRTPEAFVDFLKDEYGIITPAKAMKLDQVRFLFGEATSPSQLAHISSLIKSDSLLNLPGVLAEKVNSTSSEEIASEEIANDDWLEDQDVLEGLRELIQEEIQVQELSDGEAVRGRRLAHETPVSNRYLASELHAVTLRQAASTQTRKALADARQLSFHSIASEAKASTRKSASTSTYMLNTRNFRAQCWTTHSWHTYNSQAPERLSVVLAGRGEKALFPQEESGGRVILLLSSEQKGLARQLPGSQRDACVVQRLHLHGRDLDQKELHYLVPRRIAALELAASLHYQGTLAVLDDNLETIALSPAVGLADRPSLTWPVLLEQAGQTLYSKNLILLGLKENNPQRPLALDADTWGTTIVDKVEGEESERRYAQKAFFFNFPRLHRDFFSSFDPLAPPRLLLPQEDLFFQEVLFFSGYRCAYFDRHTIHFQRSRALRSLAVETIQSTKVYADTWLRLREDEYNLVSIPAYTKAIRRIQAIVQNAITRNLDDKKNLQEGDLLSIQESLHHPEQQNLAELSAQSGRPLEAPVRFKSKAAQKGTSPKGGGAQLSELDFSKLAKIHFGELDPDQATWQNFAEQLALLRDGQEGLFTSAEPTQRYQEHQRRALTALEPLLTDFHSQRSAYFDMATGSGKTQLFVGIIKAAHASLKGNIALVMPTLALKTQVLCDLKKAGLDCVRISSDQGDIPAEVLELNERLLQGGKIFVFCEKSFQLYVKRLASAEKLAALASYSVLIADELHLLSSDSAAVIKALAKPGNKGLALGFSATPAQVGPTYFGQAAFTYTSEEAVHEGVLVPWCTRGIHLHALESKSSSSWALPTILKTERHPMGGTLAEHPGLIYVANIEEAQAIAAALLGAGLSAFAYHSKLEKAEQERGLRAFKKGSLMVLIAVRCLREGFDANADYVLLAQRGQVDKETLLQIRGRALRKDPKKPGKIALMLSFNPEQLSKLGLKCWPHTALVVSEEFRTQAQGIHYVAFQQRGAFAFGEEQNEQRWVQALEPGFPWQRFKNLEQLREDLLEERQAALEEQQRLIEQELGLALAMAESLEKQAILRLLQGQQRLLVEAQDAANSLRELIRWVNDERTYGSVSYADLKRRFSRFKEALPSSNADEVEAFLYCGREKVYLDGILTELDSQNEGHPTKKRRDL